MTSPIRSIGPYRIDRELGRGGMGVVHLGHDTRLDRPVAIKELPAALSQEPELLARFEREARVLAQLDHPNICSIYGIEEQGGQRFLVLEFVDGESLASRIRRGPLPLDEALAIAGQVAAGVAAAHDAGVIHRDLKPENVIVRPDGRASVLDFGLSRSASDDAQGSGAHAATLVSPAANSRTLAGVILGTAAYMSPEQARGRPLDRRTDVWSFGVVLYEMLTGKRLFDGDTVSDCIASVLQREIDFAQLPESTPAAVRVLLAQCLERDLDQRRRDVGDVGMELDRIRRGESSAVTTTKAANSKLARSIAAVAILACVGLAALWVNARRANTADHVPPMVVAINTPVGTELSLQVAAPSVPSISPDGRWLVYGAQELTQRFRLHLRDLAHGTTVELEGSESGQYPFWAPDSKSIGFFAVDRGLMRIERDGGPPRVLDPQATNGKGGAWTSDGRIIYSSMARSGLWIIDAEGGERAALTELVRENDDLSHRHPKLLPGEDAFLYFRRVSATVTEDAPGEIRVRKLDGSLDRALVKSFGNGNYAGEHLLYVTDGVLVARPFDLKSLGFTGEARPIAEDVLMMRGASLAAFDVSPSGALSYVSRNTTSQRERLVWFDRSGKRLGTAIEDVDIREFVIIGDGQRVAANLLGDTGSIQRAVIDLASGNIRTLDEAIPSSAMVYVSHDGRRYAHWSTDSAGSSVFVSDVDSYAEPLQVARFDGSGISAAVHAWTAGDQALLVLRSQSIDPSADQWYRIPLVGDRTPVPIETPPDTRHIYPSPDGRWTAYRALWRADPHVFLSPGERISEGVRVTDRVVATFQWRADGKELYLRYEDGRLMVLDTSVASPAELGTPKLLLDVDRVPEAWSAGDCQVSPDGQRILVSEPMARDRFGTFTLMTDWRKTIAR